MTTLPIHSATKKIRGDKAKTILVIGTLLGFILVLYLKRDAKPKEMKAIEAPLPAGRSDFKVFTMKNPDDHEEGKVEILNDPGQGDKEPKDVENSKDVQDRGKRSADTGENVRVLCWVMTSNKTRLERASHIEMTWGQRCNKLLFISEANDTNAATIALPQVKEGSDWLWAKTKEGFKYVWENHREDADWFLKVDDDSYVILEHLRLLLKDYNTSEPIFFGCLLKESGVQKPIYADGDYVLSKEALRRFVEEAIPNEDKCKKGHQGVANIEMGHCLANVGVIAEDSRDNQKRHRFLAFHPSKYFEPEGIPKDNWIWKLSYYPLPEGLDCCSDTAISFHRIDRYEINVIEYLVYNLHPYGLFGFQDED